MTGIKLDKVFVIASIIAAIFSVILLGILHQEEQIQTAMDAIDNGDIKAFESSVSQIDDIDMVYKNETLLMRACKKGNAHAIQYLVARGADVNYSVTGSDTPLELFCTYGYSAGVEALTALLNGGARQSAYNSKPAVILLAEKYEWMSKEERGIATQETILLLQRGGPIGYKNSSVLHYAAKSDMYELFDTLVHTKQGLQLINMKDANGNTPYTIAVNSGAINVQRVIRNLEQEYKEYQGENGIDSDYTDILQPTT